MKNIYNDFYVRNQSKKAIEKLREDVQEIWNPYELEKL
jgi:hypothetical protein